MICTRCGTKKAYSESELAGMRVHGGPPLPVGICPACVMADPDLRGHVEAWSHEQIRKFIRSARDLAIRPFDAIDRFVDSLR